MSTKPDQAHGAPLRPWSSRHLDVEWTGSTRDDCWGLSGTSHQPSSKRSTMPKLRWPDSTNSVSDDPGTVQPRTGSMGLTRGHDTRRMKRSSPSRAAAHCFSPDTPSPVWFRVEAVGGGSRRLVFDAAFLARLARHPHFVPVLSSRQRPSRASACFRPVPFGPSPQPPRLSCLWTDRSCSFRLAAAGLGRLAGTRRAPETRG